MIVLKVRLPALVQTTHGRALVVSEDGSVCSWLALTPQLVASARGRGVVYYASTFDHVSQPVQHADLGHVLRDHPGFPDPEPSGVRTVTLEEAWAGSSVGARRAYQSLVAKGFAAERV